MITVQIGQCGNQIGEKLFQTLVNDCQNPFVHNPHNRFRPAPPMQAAEVRANENYVCEVKQRFFTEFDACNGDDKLLAPKSVLIDMESKVNIAFSLFGFNLWLQIAS